jgi:hypothetical protein
MISPYIEAGFEFIPAYGPVDGLATWGSGYVFSADPTLISATLLPNYMGVTIRMSAVGGAPFSLTSMDLADTYNVGQVDAVEFLFTFADNTTSPGLVTLDATPGLQTAVFNLANLISVEWVIPSGGYGAQVDNIVADVSAVPVPAALPLFASALAGLGLFGARRRQREGRT